MTTPKIWKASEISITNLVFTKKAKSVTVQYSQPLGCQAGLDRPTGASASQSSIGLQGIPLYLLSPKFEYSLPVKWERLRLSVYLNCLKANDSLCQPKGKQFGILFKQLDEYIPNIAYKNRKEWFDESLWESDLTTFQENYRRQIAYDKEKELDCIRFNLMDTEGMIYNESNKLIDTIADPLQELAFSKHHISILLKCRGIWIVEEAYGLSWDIVQIKLYKPKIALPIGCRPLDYDAIKAHQPTEIKIQGKPVLAGIDITATGIIETDPHKDEPIINYLMKDE